MCSNDYLGLANHPELVEAAADGARRWGVGAGASRLISGTLPVHVEAEQRLAKFLGSEAALLFPSGYHANLGLLSALVSEDDDVFSDSLNHASLIDGCRLSRARVHVYPHRDIEMLDRALSDRRTRGRAWVVTETLFSMDGDSPDLRALSGLVGQHGAFLVVDEAHSLGVFGPRGRGLCAEAGVTPDIIVGTLGKAFGCSGAFVAGPGEAIELALNRARTFVYTTALAPPIAAAVVRAVDLVEAADHQRAHLQTLAGRAREALRRAAIASPTGHGPIVPVLLGGDTRAIEIAEALLDRGYFVPGIRPPTVPEGTSRLRMTLSAAHSFEDVDGFCRALTELLVLPVTGVT
jgi:8-amino-7-oxononanoate synthase